MKKDAKPKTGGTVDSGLVGMLKKLSSGKPEDQLPSMPTPMHDKFYGKGFKSRKKS